MRRLVKILRGSVCVARWSLLAIGLAPGCTTPAAHKDPPVVKADGGDSGGDDSRKLWGQLRPVDKDTSSDGLSDKSRSIERDLGVQ
jgi:hypothetical protein